MTEEKALEEIREHARWGRTFVTAHARKRMKERSIFDEDLYEAIETAATCIGQPNGTWRVEGWDLDGDELILIISIEGENVIITVF